MAFNPNDNYSGYITNLNLAETLQPSPSVVEDQSLQAELDLWSTADFCIDGLDVFSSANLASWARDIQPEGSSSSDAASCGGNSSLQSPPQPPGYPALAGYQSSPQVSSGPSTPNFNPIHNMPMQPMGPSPSSSSSSSLGLDAPKSQAVLDMYLQQQLIQQQISQRFIAEQIAQQNQILQSLISTQASLSTQTSTLAAQVLPPPSVGPMSVHPGPGPLHNIPIPGPVPVPVHTSPVPTLPSHPPPPPRLAPKEAPLLPKIAPIASKPASVPPQEPPAPLVNTNNKRPLSSLLNPPSAPTPASTGSPAPLASSAPVTPPLRISTKKPAVTPLETKRGDSSQSESPSPTEENAALDSPIKDSSDKASSAFDKNSEPLNKRQRNTAASARFRAKKKQREQQLMQTAKDMTARSELLERRLREYEMEIKWLRQLVTERHGRSLADIYEQNGLKLDDHVLPAINSAEEAPPTAEQSVGMYARLYGKDPSIQGLDPAKRLRH
ncbi:uncharacterized protein BJ171DRAFT_209271 [Polychytrium aggregatum]|uniref:uncharacterized protein n=1 Tax=Polychytrium aggregatum TaxID=110093 RepID=UPI0022FE2BF1|nr:uncharacterized protein BJ171DRAFT_209271 [Polychytrium aggregatum]KAI9208532.1 hypothetical protein BJ171DRAFT_209271 [Polychytrium aggregatum]